MNFYDKIHELVRSLKDTDEYKKYLQIKKKVSDDSNIYNKLKDFKQKQQKSQLGYMSTGKLDEAGQQEIQKIYVELIGNQDVKEFFEAEIKLDVMLADMQKIIGDGIKEIIEF